MTAAMAELPCALGAGKPSAASDGGIIVLIVQKFGGSSLAAPDGLRRAARIIDGALREGHSVAAVVSAMGDTTDDLKTMAREISSVPAPRELDALLTTGEQQSAALLTMTLGEMGIEAVSLTGFQCGIVTDSSYGSAEIELILPYRCEELLKAGKVPVITGFQGITPRGNITSLGRGGSDTTAVAMAAALSADRCQIYTDVDGIFTADPRLVPEARKLRRIDYRDMLALAAAGSQVLHPRSVELGMNHSVEIQLLSSFSPSEGSLVCHLPVSEQPDYAGITRDREKRLITLAGKAADAEALSRAVIALAEAKIAVEKGYVSPGAVSVRVEDRDLLPALKLLHGVFLA